NHEDHEEKLFFAIPSCPLCSERSERFVVNWFQKQKEPCFSRALFIFALTERYCGTAGFSLGFCFGF
ncbi:MAG: hypothetical protein LPH20_10630, partial [Shewanella sp.]|nr:hypothetical protein [Shewanella sp.]